MLACDALKPNCSESMTRIMPDKHDYECSAGASISVKEGFVYCKCPAKIDPDAGTVTLTIDASAPAPN